MQNMFNNEELQLLKNLKEKYASNESEFKNQLEALFYNKGVDYWEYIQLDALLGIQHCKTEIDDEIIFIVYHQICELYFKLIRHEISLLTDPDRKEYLEANNWMKRIGRLVNYIAKLTHSFDIMSPGEMGSDQQFFSTEEFSKFRLNLMPASGFQTISMRKIEIMSTGLKNLVKANEREQQSQSGVKELYQNLYWKEGGHLMQEDGRLVKTKTLIAFEKKYNQELLEFARKFENRNLEYIFFKLKPGSAEEAGKLGAIRDSVQIKTLLKTYDKALNIDWKQNHFNIIKKHMPDSKHGTGGTNWKKYLPPSNQQISYFPEL